MRHVAILYDLYYDFFKESITIGGIQTYIADLAKICLDLKYKVKVFQMGDSYKTVSINGYVVEQIQVKSCDYTNFFNKVYHSMSKDTLVVFATETMVPKNLMNVKAISIQHGVYWDKPYRSSRNALRMFLSKAYRNYNIVRHIMGLTTLVCVDYNYVNWLRAETDNISTNLTVIPNYTKISPKFKKKDNQINIIFARRLFEYRGTRVFTSAIKRVLNEYSSVYVTIAGTGPDENYMKHELADFCNVEFITYKSSESIKIHSDKHIAVVPTIGSEGTSLSLLEAMSAQCAVIASNVGGMTNIVLDNYNGLLVNAGDVDDLYYALKKLIENPGDLKRLSDKGYETVKQAFSYDRWMERWKNVIVSISER